MPTKTQLRNDAGNTDDADRTNHAEGEAPRRVSERVTVNLSTRSAQALEEAAGLTGDSKTEVINKALQLYSMVRVAQDDGGGAWIQDSAATDPVRSRFY